MPEALNLPAAMVQAAAEGLRGWLADSDWLDCAHDALTAALAGCEVREEWGARGEWSDGETWTSMADNEAVARKWLADSASSDAKLRLVRRLVITTPGEEVPDA